MKKPADEQHAAITHTQIGRRGFVVGVAATLMACGDDASTPDALSVDGGADGGFDGGSDGGSDAGFDGGSDAGADAGADAPDASIDLQPEMLVGFGAATTGGRGGRVVVVTELGDGESEEGTLHWAFEQHRGEPLYVCLAVEGGIRLRSPFVIDRPDVTIDGRFAPGAGAWVFGDRIEVEADNVLLDHVRHFGNDTAANGDSDCLRWGIYSTDAGDRDDVQLGYLRCCEFHHGRDEVLAFTVRRNGQATGNRVQDVTWDRCIVANPTGLDHEFGVIVGDGAERITLSRNLFFNFSARYPFVRRHASEIESINNACYNFNENCIAISGAEVAVLGNLLRLGPRWNDIRGPLSISGSNFYLDDMLVDSLIGRTNTTGLYREGSSADAPTFAGSGLEAIPSADVADMIARLAGARLHGGERGTVSQTVIDQFVAGNAPTELEAHPGDVPRETGASFPEHAAYVPREYQAFFAGDSNLDDTIEDGPWAGYLVAERVGAWLISS